MLMSGWQKKRRVMRRYDLTAEMYDNRYAEEQTAKIIAALKNLTQHNGFILDAGCGTGLLFNFVADKAKLTVGIDISKKTLMQALRQIEDLKIPNIFLVQADLDNMPFETGVFGRIFSMTVLQNSPDRSQTLAEIKRVGKNDATFVITGLKSIFSKVAFRRLLKNAGMRITAFEDENLKCYVAICTNSASR
jgi:ubiquinone/menaquinone biosynthesis C-methylase UbiE